MVPACTHAHTGKSTGVFSKGFRSKEEVKGHVTPPIAEGQSKTTKRDKAFLTFDRLKLHQ